MANLTFYGMFDYIAGDNDTYRYSSAEWSALIKGIVGNGVSKNDRNMFETTNSGLNLTVGTGTAFVEGHYGYTNSTQAMTLAATSAGISRYDRLVVELDQTNRVMSLKVVVGTAAASPSVPSLTQTALIYQIPVYKILVANGSTVTLTDERVFTYNSVEVQTQLNSILTTLAGKSNTSHTHTPASLGAATSTHGHALTDAAITGTLAVAKGGTGATSASGALTALGAAAASHTHAPTDITTAVPLTKGGTGATSAAAALTSLGAAASGHTHALTDSTLTGSLPVSKGGTGSTTASGALTALGAAASTHTHGLTDAAITGTLSVAKGGTGATNEAAALTALGAAASSHTHAIDGSTITGTLPLTRGGTGACYCQVEIPEKWQTKIPSLEGYSG